MQDFEIVVDDEVKHAYLPKGSTFWPKGIKTNKKAVAPMSPSNSRQYI